MTRDIYLVWWDSLGYEDNPELIAICTTEDYAHRLVDQIINNRIAEARVGLVVSDEEIRAKREERVKKRMSTYYDIEKWQVHGD